MINITDEEFWENNKQQVEMFMQYMGVDRISVMHKRGVLGFLSIGISNTPLVSLVKDAVDGFDLFTAEWEVNSPWWVRVRMWDIALDHETVFKSITIGSDDETEVIIPIDRESLTAILEAVKQTTMDMAENDRIAEETLRKKNERENELLSYIENKTKYNIGEKV